MFALFVDFLQQHPKTESHSKAQADMENQHWTKAELTRVGLCSPWWVSGGPAGRKLFLLMPNEMQLRSVELNYQELIQWKVTGASSVLLQNCTLMLKGGKSKFVMLPACISEVLLTSPKDRNKGTCAAGYLTVTCRKNSDQTAILRGKHSAQERRNSLLLHECHLSDKTRCKKKKDQCKELFPNPASSTYNCSQMIPV